MKEERFEKVVEDGDDIPLCVLGILSIAISILVSCSFFYDWNFMLIQVPLVCADFGCLLIWVTGLIAGIDQRNVYWRKISN